MSEGGGPPPAPHGHSGTSDAAQEHGIEWPPVKMPQTNTTLHKTFPAMNATTPRATPPPLRPATARLLHGPPFGPNPAQMALGAVELIIVTVGEAVP